MLALELPTKFVFVAPEWGYTLISLGADIVVVFLIIDFLLLREERQRWKSVEGKAIERVQSELFGVFFFAFSMLSPPIDLFSSNEEKMSRMRELVADPKKLRSTMRALDFGFSSYLESLARRVGELQLRYSSRFDPRLTDILMDIENSLESMTSFLSTLHNFPDAGGEVRDWTWMPFLDLIGALVKAVDQGFIKLPPYTPPSI